jgi:hypothetical protein
MITEQNLVKLGFTKYYGDNNEWYYYTLDIGDISLTSTESDLIETDNWLVYVDEHSDFVINNLSNLNGLINILHRILEGM